MTSYDPKRPWESVMRAAASNVEFWLRELQEPACIFGGSVRVEVAPSWTQQQPEQQQLGTKRNVQLMLADKPPNDEQEQEVCRNFNMRRCNYDNCRRRHVCSNCGKSGHPSTRCRKKGAGKGKKQGGKQTGGKKQKQAADGA